MTPQWVPVVEPLRHTDAPTGASCEPATGTVPPLKSLTTGCGVQLPLTATTPKSLSPGNDDAVNWPWACWLNPVVVPPTCPQCPAVTKPVVTEKPIEQRARLSMKYGSPPRTSNSGRGRSFATTTRTEPAATPDRPSHRLAAETPSGWATTTTWLVDTSTYQPATAAELGAERRSRALLVARSVDSF